MKRSLALFLSFLSLGSLAYEGPTFSAAVWRGETAYIKVPDNMVGGLCRHWVAAKKDKDKPDNGIALDLFIVDNTPYSAAIGSEQVLFRRDRARLYDVTDGFSLPPDICRITTSVTAKAGTYDFGPMKLRVLDRVLPSPKDWKYYLDLWQHPWAVARVNGVKPFSKEHYDKMAVVWKALADCGQKVLTTTLLDLPWNHQCYDAYHSMIGRVKKDDGTWVYDYKLFDEYVEFGRKCGIGPDIACYTMCPWGYVVRWENEKGEVQRAEAKPGTPVFDDYWGDFLVDFAKHLKEKGWFKNTYVAMDERSPEDVRYISEFIQKKVPGMKISMAGNRKASDFQGITIDNYCQGLSHLSEDCFADLPARREQGFITTFYVCCDPVRPNTFMTSADDEAFWLGVYPALSGFDGFLRWAANSWPFSPCDNAAFGYWAPGDTFLFYPGGQLSTRMIALRAGIVAAEKARILNAEGKFASALKELNAKYGYEKAMKGAFDHRACRREIESLVNP